MNTMIYKNYFLFIITAFIGIALTYVVSNIIPKNKIAKALSINSLFILAFHMEALRYIKLAVLKKVIIPTYMENFMAKPIIAIIVAPIIEVILVLILQYIYRILSNSFRFLIKEKTYN